MSDSLISVHLAEQIVLGTARTFGEEFVAINDAMGRTLAENVCADRDFPPFDRVTMDGFALRYEAYSSGQKTFPIEKLQAAGQAQTVLQDPSAAIEIMTGASLPINADTVVRYEDTKQVGDQVTFTGPVRQGSNIHRRGEDIAAGTCILPIGKNLGSMDLAVLATVGKVEVKVRRLPKTAVVTTGDELVDVNEVPLPHQIRRSNVYAIAGILKNIHIIPDSYHLADKPEALQEALAQIDREYELVILSGGVSMGKKDYLPAALEKIGVVKAFHKVAQRPGKPLWFGSSERTTWFALPGNPVSAYMCTLRYVVPWIEKCLAGEPGNIWTAILNEDFSFEKPLQYFLQVKMSIENGQVTATPVPGNGSGDLANLSFADAFLELPADKSQFAMGESFRLWPFNPIIL